MEAKIREIAAAKAEEFKKRKRAISVKSLLKKFGYQRRTDEATQMITKVLQEYNIYLSPPIVKMGNQFNAERDEKITFIVGKKMGPGVVRQTNYVTKRKDSKPTVRTVLVEKPKVEKAKVEKPKDSLVSRLIQKSPTNRVTRIIRIGADGVRRSVSEPTKHLQRTSKVAKPLKRKATKVTSQKKSVKNPPTKKPVVKKQTVAKTTSKPKARITKRVTKQYPWITKILKAELRNEREVESRFIIPILENLGYTQRDRYEEMPIIIQVGSKRNRVKADFVLYAKNERKLKDVELLVVEGKNPTKRSLSEAVEQVRSYSQALYCHFGMVTNGNEIKVLQFFNHIGKKPKVVFKCNRDELKTNFSKLEKLISKKSLVNFYTKL